MRGPITPLAAQRHLNAPGPNANAANAHDPAALKVLPVSTIRKLMRVWLSIFLILFLPLQSAWAVAAPYCGHENSVRVSHFGHHAHQHHAADAVMDASKDTSGGSASIAVDVDCTPCNGMGSAMVINFSPAVFFMGKTHYASSVTPESLLAPRQRPERPKWPRLA